MVYSKVLEVGQISSSTAVPFRITGKVILDAASNTQNLIAGWPNELKILIKNEGSADANGVVAYVIDVTEGTTTPAVSNSNSNVIRNSEPSSNDSYSGNNATEPQMIKQQHKRNRKSFLRPQQLASKPQLLMWAIFQQEDLRS